MVIIFIIIPKTYLFILQNYLQFFFFFRFIYLRERERETHTHTEKMEGGSEGDAEIKLNRLHVEHRAQLGLHLMTLKS